MSQYRRPACGRHTPHGPHSYPGMKGGKVIPDLIMCMGWEPGTSPYSRERAYGRPPVPEEDLWSQHPETYVERLLREAREKEARNKHVPPMSRDQFCDEAKDLIPHPPHEWGQHSSIGGTFTWAMFQCPGHFTMDQLRLREQIYGMMAVPSWQDTGITVIPNG